MGSENSQMHWVLGARFSKSPSAVAVYWVWVWFEVPILLLPEF